MKLSDRQVRIVNAFLRDAALETPPDPPTARTEVLTHIRRRLRDELARRNDSPLHDEELIRLLNRIQLPEKAAQADSHLDRRLRAIPFNDENTPVAHTNGELHIIKTEAEAVFTPSHRARVAETAAATPAASPRPLPSGPLASSQRVWLGVCLAIGDRFDVAVGPVRAVVGAAGLLTGPIAVVLYLFAYAYFYLGPHGDGAPRVDRMRLFRSLGETSAALISLVVVFAAGVWCVDWVYALAIGYPQEADRWSSFAESANRLVLWGAIFLLPFSALAGLPVAPPWDWSIPRALRTGLIMLGMLLSLAFASYLTGALLGAVREWPA